jgi:hypothetical protein
MENNKAVEKFAEGQRVLYTEQNFHAVVRDVHARILTGMYDIRLDRGCSCVDGSELRAFVGSDAEWFSR